MGLAVEAAELSVALIVFALVANGRKPREVCWLCARKANRAAVMCDVLKASL